MRHFLNHLDRTDLRDFAAIVLFLTAVAIAAALGSGA